MKKWLLGTSALVGAIAVATTAQAQLEVTLGGELDFRATVRDQDVESATTDRDTVFTNDTEIHLGVEGKADNGLVYGAVVELNADASADNTGTNSDGNNADKTYIFVESDLGRVEMGANVGPTKTLKVDASSIAAAAGGIDGDVDEYISSAQATTGGGFIMTPDLVADQLETTEDANKVTYYTPRLAGFQFGISYAPDSGDVGTVGGVSGVGNNDQWEDLVQAGLNYTGEFEGVGVQGSLTYETADSEANGGNNGIDSIAVGLGLDLEGIQLAGSYGDIDDVYGNTTDGSFYTLGVAYASGPFNASVTWLSSEYQDAVATGDNEFDNIAIGIDYQLAPGLTPYIDVNFFEADDANTAGNDNEGSVVFLGTALNF